MNIILSFLFFSYLFGTEKPSNVPELNVKNFEDVKKLATDISMKPYMDHRKKLPKWIRDMDYDDIRRINFRTKKAIWRSERLPFQLLFFHPGCIQTDQIRVHLIDGDRVETVPFEQDVFEYGKELEPEPLGEDTMFSGFKINCPLNSPDRLDELIVFQGATYYRALAQNLFYGISSRTISVNTWTNVAEEFPAYTDFWVYRPDRNDTSVKILGLFNSPSLAGAAEFVIKPGISTVMDIKVFIHTRKNEIANYGISPLTSMFWFGENSRNKWGEFRPEVHDSDGLLIHSESGEWIWRPLSNDENLKKSCFGDKAPKGFGLIQRDRSFRSYMDLEARYHLRPSVWVEPTGVWGDGFVELIEAPSHVEYYDNIVAMWRPAKPIPPESGIEFCYRQTWVGENRLLPDIGKTTGTYIAYPPATPPESRKFVIEFYWPDVEADAKSGNLQIITEGDNATIKNTQGIFNPYENTYRVFFDTSVIDKGKPVELRVKILKNGQPLTETWTYQWTP